MLALQNYAKAASGPSDPVETSVSVVRTILIGNTTYGSLPFQWVRIIINYHIPRNGNYSGGSRMRVNVPRVALGLYQI